MSSNKLTVEEYQKLYAHEFGFLFNETTNVFVVLSPAIVAKEAVLLSKLARFNLIVAKYAIKSAELELTNIAEIIDKKYVSQIVSLGQMFSVNVRVGVLADMVFRGVSPTNAEEKVVYNLYRIFRRLDDGISLKEVSKVINGTEEFRTFEIDKNEFGLSGIPSPFIEHVYSSIKQLNSEAEYPPLMCAALTYFEIRYARLWEKNNKAMAFFGFFQVLANAGYGDVLFLSNFIKILAESNSEIDTVFMNSVKDKGDITHLYYYFIEKLEKAITESSKDFEELNAIQKKEIAYLTVREKNIQIQRLIIKYPTLSKKQADFYVEHSKAGSSYTIQDFIRTQGTSFETGRSSMEKLAELGFYNKVKVGKKFIYTVRRD